jgi:hypothetical protein
MNLIQEIIADSEIITTPEFGFLNKELGLKFQITISSVDGTLLDEKTEIAILDSFTSHIKELCTLEVRNNVEQDRIFNKIIGNLITKDSFKEITIDTPFGEVKGHVYYHKEVDVAIIDKIIIEDGTVILSEKQQAEVYALLEKELKNEES